MLRNRLIYFFSLGAAAAFYLANGAWFSWFLLILVLVLPLFSFLCSLFFMLRTKITPSLPSELTLGEEGALVLSQTGSYLPYQLRVNRRTLRPEVTEDYPLNTEHCGRVELQLRRCRVYDALGLTGIRRKVSTPLTTVILPRPIPPKEMPDPLLFQTVQFKPQPGTLTEQHELREYRPGDPSRLIHWKASLKNDKLIVREAQEPVRRRIVLALRCPRTAAAFDQSFGQLRWLSLWLLEQDVPHQVCCVLPEGLRTLEVTDEETHHSMLLTVAGVVPGSVAALPQGLSAGADWFCLVGEEGIG